eukprot:Skav225998  [mRNA]  locus=scaffold1762:33531:35060:+ [translate_table: standard]
MFLFFCRTLDGALDLMSCQGVAPIASHAASALTSRAAGATTLDEVRRSNAKRSHAETKDDKLPVLTEEQSKSYKQYWQQFRGDRPTAPVASPDIAPVPIESKVPNSPPVDAPSPGAEAPKARLSDQCWFVSSKGVATEDPPPSLRLTPGHTFLPPSKRAEELQEARSGVLEVPTANVAAAETHRFHGVEIEVQIPDSLNSADTRVSSTGTTKADEGTAAAAVPVQPVPPAPPVAPPAHAEAEDMPPASKAADPTATHVPVPIAGAAAPASTAPPMPPASLDAPAPTVQPEAPLPAEPKACPIPPTKLFGADVQVEPLTAPTASEAIPATTAAPKPPASPDAPAPTVQPEAPLQPTPSAATPATATVQPEAPLPADPTASIVPTPHTMFFRTSAQVKAQAQFMQTTPSAVAPATTTAPMPAASPDAPAPTALEDQLAAQVESVKDKAHSMPPIASEAAPATRVAPADVPGTSSPLEKAWKQLGQNRPHHQMHLHPLCSLKLRYQQIPPLL